MSVKAVTRSDGTPCDDAARRDRTSAARPTARWHVIARYLSRLAGTHCFARINNSLISGIYDHLLDLRDYVEAYLLT